MPRTHGGLAGRLTSFENLLAAYRLRILAGGPGARRNRRVRESLCAWLGHTRWGDSYRLNRLVLARAGLLAAPLDQAAAVC